MSSKKLQNVKAVRQMLDGNHRMQTRTTVGWEPKKEMKIRAVGEQWEEVLPNGQIALWVQEKGYRRRIQKNMVALSEARLELQEFKNCYDNCEKKESKKYSRYDNDVRDVHGMCLDCWAKKVTEMKAKGEYEFYVNKKELYSTISFLKEAAVEKEFIKKSLDNIGITSEEGVAEKWTVENKIAFYKRIDDDFLKLRKKQLEPFLKLELDAEDKILLEQELNSKIEVASEALKILEDHVRNSS